MEKGIVGTLVIVGVCAMVVMPAWAGDVFNMPAGLTSLEFVTVGNPGNAGELSGGGLSPNFGPERICGAVDYTYDIGKFEVTAGQYCEFLNAVAATDTNGLYDTNMWTGEYGCKIERTGSPGSYRYSVAGDRANRPVNYISWGDTVRFCNWLHNGQPTGAQDVSTTEDGAYRLEGIPLLGVTRKADARYFLPLEDEWYKAAYYDAANGWYQDYPLGVGGQAPSNKLVDPDPGTNANYYVDANFDREQQESEFTVGAPYWTTEVGEFENSVSPYGTYDQAGNVWEWNQSIAHQLVRGGSFLAANRFGDYWLVHAKFRWGYFWMAEDYSDVGFRVAAIPEPVTLSVLAMGGVAMLRRRKG